jgi:hypothetical protein
MFFAETITTSEVEYFALHDHMIQPCFIKQFLVFGLFCVPLSALFTQCCVLFKEIFLILFSKFMRNPGLGGVFFLGGGGYIGWWLYFGLPGWSRNKMSNPLLQTTQHYMWKGSNLQVASCFYKFLKDQSGTKHIMTAVLNITHLLFITHKVYRWPFDLMPWYISVFSWIYIKPGDQLHLLKHNPVVSYLSEFLLDFEIAFTHLSCESLG